MKEKSAKEKTSEAKKSVEKREEERGGRKTTQNKDYKTHITQPPAPQHQLSSLSSLVDILISIRKHVLAGTVMYF